MNSSRILLAALMILCSMASCSDPGDDSLDECNAVAQDCAWDTQRCILVYAGPDREPYTRCWSLGGDDQLDEVCTRPSSLETEWGYDTCAAGLFCTSLGMPFSDPQELNCRPYCNSNSHCEPGEFCKAIAGSSHTGHCATACTLFEDGCPADQGCYRHSSFGVWRAGCMPAGEGTTGSPCEFTNDCAPHHACLVRSSTQYCIPACDDDHPCDGGLTCNVFSNGGDTNFGYCED
jgi:hypothetical protein